MSADDCRGAWTPRRSVFDNMTDHNRNQTDETNRQEIIDADSEQIRRDFDTPVKDYVTGNENNILLAEANKGAAWIEADPSDVLNAEDCR